MNSVIYQGNVRHRRYAVKPHDFNYGMFLLALDLDELVDDFGFGRLLAVEKRAVMSFRHQDYLGGKGKLTRQRVWDKVAELDGEVLGGKVVLLGQLRCFGFYFSPVNFYYCHDQAGELRYLLAEVSNTPWKERHCYLIDAQDKTAVEKVFHVSPFMNEDMDYHWRFTPLNPRLYLNIENRKQDKVFDATLIMDQQALTRSNLIKNLLRIPAMTITTVIGIHWQAVRLWLKGVPYIPYVKKKEMT